MARRRIEKELRANLNIPPDAFTRIEEVKKIEFENNRDGIFCLQFSMDGKMLSVGHGNGGIKVYDVETMKPMCEPKKSRYGAYPTLALKWHPKERNIFFSGDAEGHLFTCDVRAKDSVKSVIEKGNQINCVDFSADGFYFGTAGKDKTIRIYETRTNKLFKDYLGTTGLALEEDDDGVLRSQVPNLSDDTVGPHHQRIYALKFHPGRDDIFITAGWDDGLKVWDIRGNDVKRTIRSNNLPHVCGDAIDILEDDIILTGSWVGAHSLQMWEYTSGELIKDIPFPNSDHVEIVDNNNRRRSTGASKGAFLYCAQFADNNCVLAGGSGTCSVQAINHESGQSLGEVKMIHCVQALDSTAGGRLFVVGGQDQFMKVAKLC